MKINENIHVVASLFSVESEAYQAFTQLRKQENTATCVVAQAALIKKTEGKIQLEEIFDPAESSPVISGGLIGALVGVLGGPLGLLLGGSLGMLIGSDISLAESLGESTLIEAVASKLNQGDVAVIVLAEENDEAVLNNFFAAYKTTVLRWEAEQVREEIIQAAETELALQKQARAALRAQKNAERKQEFEEKWQVLKESVNHSFEKLKAKL